MLAACKVTPPGVEPCARLPRIDMPPARIACKVGLPGLSYPYGDAPSAGTREFQLARELGVTTHKGLVQASMPRQQPPGARLALRQLSASLPSYSVPLRPALRSPAARGDRVTQGAGIPGKRSARSGEAPHAKAGESPL